MKLKPYVNKCFDKWPKEISMENTKYIPETKGFLFGQLIKVYDEIEESESTFFEGIIMYEIYGLYFNKMKENFQRNLFKKVEKNEIDINILLQNIEKEVLESGSEKLIKQYEKMKE
jgi:hypothetical protein